MIVSRVTRKMSEISMRPGQASRTTRTALVSFSTATVRSTGTSSLSSKRRKPPIPSKHPKHSVRGSLCGQEAAAKGVHCPRPESQRCLKSAHPSEVMPTDLETPSPGSLVSEHVRTWSRRSLTHRASAAQRQASEKAEDLALASGRQLPLNPNELGLPEHVPELVEERPEMSLHLERMRQLPREHLEEEEWRAVAPHHVEPNDWGPMQVALRWRSVPTPYQPSVPSSQ